MPPHITSECDVCIVGAGISGLLSAIELADAGCRVHIIDRARAAMEATWAGGGIISPLYPWRYTTAITALATYSQSIFPAMINRLKETGINPEYSQMGMLVTATSERKQALKWGAGLQAAVKEISIDDARALEPNVSVQESPLWMPRIGSVRTPRLGQAMRKACFDHSGIILSEHKTVSLRGSVDSPVLDVDGASIVSDRVLIAAGAWTTSILSPLGIKCPIKPMKGQMLLFAPSDLISRVVLANGRYAIPRMDGRIVFGSTLEDVGFERLPDQMAFEDLYSSALLLIPDLSNFPLELQWAGFRPGSPNGTPWIGALSARLWVNAGHYRNGVVLGPASARLIADLMVDRAPCVDPSPFKPKD